LGERLALNFKWAVKPHSRTKNVSIIEARGIAPPFFLWQWGISGATIGHEGGNFNGKRGQIKKG